MNAYKKYEEKIVEAVRKFKMIKSLSYFCVEFERAFVDEKQRDPLFEKRTVHITVKSKEM